MSFVLEVNIKIFLHLFLRLYPFLFICMFISLLRLYDIDPTTSPAKVLIPGTRP